MRTVPGKICAILFGCAVALALIASASAQTAPPWGGGNNDPTASKGYVFQVGSIDDVPDLHGNPCDAKLVLFIGGNQFFVVPRLIAGFEAQHSELRGYIYYETLPPGILRRQMANNNTLTLGNLTVRAAPDVYEAGAGVVDGMARQGVVEKSVHYATNDLAIMVAAGNPKHIRGLKDLGKPAMRLSMPNPVWEGVERQIAAALRKAGGDALYQEVYVQKVANGTTYLTQIHHRQTPMRILQGKSDAGVTWASEARFQETIHNAIAGVAIPASENSTAIYAAGVLKNAPHAAAARAWVRYLTTPAAQNIYRDYGFQPAVDKAH
ncbi:MAG: substrate-binding domain-containing protein [Acidobacteriaceae bacterium]